MMLGTEVCPELSSNLPLTGPGVSAHQIRISNEDVGSSGGLGGGTPELSGASEGSEEEGGNSASLVAGGSDEDRPSADEDSGPPIDWQEVRLPHGGEGREGGETEEEGRLTAGEEDDEDEDTPTSVAGEFCTSSMD